MTTPDPFTHLHTHCEYSFLDGFGHPADFVQRAHELGQRAIAITDHGNVSAHKRWNDACVERGMKPILGVEAYVCDDSTARNNRTRWHITILAKTLKGYQNLLKVVSLSWEHGFYYKPRTDWDILKQYGEGLIVTSGCPSSRIGRGIRDSGWREPDVAKELDRQAAIFKDYYVELSPWNYPEGITTARLVYQVAKAKGLPMILTMDAHYPRPQDASTQDIMLCIQNNTLFNDPARMRFSQQDFAIHSGAEMAEKWQALHRKEAPLLEDMLLNTQRITDSVDFLFPSATPLSYSHDGDKVELLRQWCREGLKRKGLSDKAKYSSRMRYEFELVVSKQFVDYFLVVGDLIRWAKGQGIVVGAARGSSCGSLMCYVIGITEIDPLQHNLMFERFIDVNRADLPDIDIDFESERRHEVKAYLESKYGADKVANLPTFGTFKGRLCLQDIGRIFRDVIPPEAITETKRLIVQRSSADARAGFTIEDTFTNFEKAAEWLKKYPQLAVAKALEGQIRQLGVHAAGIVISQEPIGNFAAIYTTPQKKDRVISMDYHDANSIGLLKIDVLGLTVLTAIKRILKLVKERHGVDIDISTLPLDDRPVYEAFCRQELQGIFQFDGLATRQVCRQVKPENFEHLVAINALSRPGPLHSGSTTSFIARRWGREETVYLHPMLEGVTRETYGITVYQEQVMHIVRNMGKFDWGQTAQIRKAMSKKFGNEFFDKMRVIFIEGARSQGVSEEDAVKVWLNICTFGSWCFNKSHSVAYSITAYQLMWLKVHYPNEFYAGSISCENDELVKKGMIREFISKGGKALPVSVNKSQETIACEGEALRLGLDSVKGLTEAVKKQLLTKRPFRSYIDFTSKCKVPPKQADILLRVGAFRDLKFDTLDQQLDMFGANAAKTATFDYQNPKDDDVRQYCPLAIDDKLCDKWRAWVKKTLRKPILTVRDLEGITEKQDVIILGNCDPDQFNLKNKLEESRSYGKEWEAPENEKHWDEHAFDFLNFDVDDGTASVIVRVSYKQYPKFKDMLWEVKPDEVVAVQGMYNGIMWMVFAFTIVNLTRLRRKLEANEPLDEHEQNFINGKRGRRADRWTVGNRVGAYG